MAKQLELKLESGIIYDTYDTIAMIIDIKNKKYMAIGEIDFINKIFKNMQEAYISVPYNKKEDIILLEIDCQYALECSFSNINYAITLYNQQIQALGNRSSFLTEQEKEVGDKIIRGWETTVIKQLVSKQIKLKGIDCYIKGNSASNSNPTIEELRQLADMSDTLDELEQILALKEDIIDLQLDKPILPKECDSLTGIKNQNNFQKYQMDILKWSQKYNKLETKIINNTNKWKLKMRKHDNIKNFLELIASKLEDIDQLIDDAKDKSQLARLNVAIGDLDTRKALFEMLEFTKNI